jgi:hypothetical protein
MRSVEDVPKNLLENFYPTKVGVDCHNYTALFNQFEAAIVLCKAAFQ